MTLLKLAVVGVGLWMVGSAGPHRADAAWLRVGVLGVDIAALHDGKPWDSTGKRKLALSCCHPGKAEDETLPDGRVLLRFGKQEFSTRVRPNELHPEFLDFGFLNRADSDPLSVLVYDDDDQTAQLIGRTELRVPTSGLAKDYQCGRFGSVEGIRLYAEPVPVPVATIEIGADVGELDSHLFIPANQKIWITARGQTCLKRQCFSPGGDSAARPQGESPGRLRVLIGSEEDTQAAEYLEGLTMVSRASGVLRLYVEPAPKGRLTGSYEVQVRFE